MQNGEKAVIPQVLGEFLEQATKKSVLGFTKEEFKRARVE